MVNIRRFTGVPFTDLDQLVERGTLSGDAARFLTAAVRVGATIVFAGAPGSGKTTLLSCCVGALDPFAPGRHRRGGLRDRRTDAERGVDADPGGPSRPTGRRPPPPRRRIPPHGPRRGHRRRGPRPGGAAAVADAVLGGEGLHHDPCRPTAAAALVAGALPRRALGVGPQPPALGARRRWWRRPSTWSCSANGPRPDHRSPRSSRWRISPAAPSQARSPSPTSSPARGPDRDLALDR